MTVPRPGDAVQTPAQPYRRSRPSALSPLQRRHGDRRHEPAASSTRHRFRLRLLHRPGPPATTGRGRNKRPLWHLGCRLCRSRHCRVCNAGTTRPRQVRQNLIRSLPLPRTTMRNLVLFLIAILPMSLPLRAQTPADQSLTAAPNGAANSETFLPFGLNAPTPAEWASADAELTATSSTSSAASPSRPTREHASTDFG